MYLFRMPSYREKLTITGSPMSRQASFLYGPLPTLIPFRQKTISHFCWAGDSQIGASGDVAADTYSWNKVLNTALKKVPNASFLLSLGDQVDYKTSTGDQGLREQQYAGFLYLGVLRSLPVATVIGNHDTKGPDYSYHFNNPNAQSGYGATPAGCDYYFSRGSALFIVLNSNNRNQASHRKLLKEP